ncbi:MAG TPA: glycosyltransferase 87 family protein [Acidimicrobiia bacterium]
MLAACSLVLLAGFALQVVAYGHGGQASISDIPRLVLHRDLTPGHWPYVDRLLEYPVLAGLLLGAAVAIGSSPFGALAVVAVFAALTTLGITWVLHRRFDARAWRWAIGTPVLLYAFQNWDVFAVAALVLGLLAFERRRDRTAGVMFGLGAAVKLFPLVVVPPLAALRWVHGDRQGARRLVLSSFGAFALVNAPFAVLHPSHWWWTYSFQSSRQATWGSAWFYGLRMAGLPVHGASGAQIANVVTAVALVAGLTWLVVRTVRLDLDAFAAAAAAVAICILANKVYSPTYDVWLVAFFVMLPLGRRLWLTFYAVDLAVFGVVYGYFDGPVHVDVVRTLLPVLVVLRTAVLLTFVVRATEPPARARADVSVLVAS